MIYIWIMHAGCKLWHIGLQQIWLVPGLELGFAFALLLGTSSIQLLALNVLTIESINGAPSSIWVLKIDEAKAPRVALIVLHIISASDSQLWHR